MAHTNNLTHQVTFTPTSTQAHSYAISRTISEVPTLNHEVLDNTMEHTTFVGQRFTLGPHAFLLRHKDIVSAIVSFVSPLLQALHARIVCRC